MTLAAIVFGGIIIVVATISLPIYLRTLFAVVCDEFTYRWGGVMFVLVAGFILFTLLATIIGTRKRESEFNRYWDHRTQYGYTSPEKYPTPERYFP